MCLAAVVLLGACQGKQVAGAYPKLHSNVRFELITQPLEDDKGLLETQFEAGNAPDIIHMQEGLIQELSNKDALLNLDRYMYTKSP